VRHNYLPATGDLTVTDTWQYTGLGGRTSQRDTTVGSGTGFSGGSFRASQSWNDLGLVSVLKYPARCTGSNCSMPDQRAVTDTYTNGFLTGVTNFASTITYQPNGLIDTVAHANAVNETWIPDPKGMTRPCAIFAYGSGVTLSSGTTGLYPGCSHSLTGGTPASVRFGSGEYAYDASGNVKAIGLKSYTYDGVSRFTSSNNGESVAYDMFGNITNHSGQAGNVDSTTNRLTTATYDAAGNVTALISSNSSQSATWDGLSMMQSFRAYATGPHNVSGHPLSNSSYVYDPDDERIALIAGATGDLVSSERTVTTYTLRGFDPHLLRSYTDDLRPLDNPQPPNSELWTLKEDEIWRGSQLLALVAGDGYTIHYTLDHLGSPATLTDSEGIASTPSFDPFGTGGINFGALQFTGHERDQGAGLDYMHARFYTAGWGRFMSVDPAIGDAHVPQTWNRYAYCIDDPIAKTDANGKGAHDEVKHGVGIALVLSGAVPTGQPDNALARYLDEAFKSVTSEELLDFQVLALVDPAAEPAILSAQAGIAARATEIQEALPAATQRRTTTAVAEVTNLDGTTQRLVGSSENALRPSQRAALRPGETAVAGPGHAEQTVINAAQNNGQTVNAVAASRPICTPCAISIYRAGAVAASALKTAKQFLRLLPFL